MVKWFQYAGYATRLLSTRGCTLFDPRCERDENRTLGKITEEDVREVVLSGEIIQEYPEDKSHPSVLILGYTRNGRPIHVVTTHIMTENKALVITSYEPTPELWFDLRRRKRE